MEITDLTSHFRSEVNVFDLNVALNMRRASKTPLPPLPGESERETLQVTRSNTAQSARDTNEAFLYVHSGASAEQMLDV